MDIIYLPFVPILQDADPFLETAGEDMRRRIFITESASGAMQCLRPEFTIPICLTHAEKPGRYAYGGTVVRQGRAYLLSKATQRLTLVESRDFQRKLLE